MLEHMYNSITHLYATATTSTSMHKENLGISPIKRASHYHTFLCSIFLPVLVKAIPCIDKDLPMCTVAYESLMVEL